MVAILSGTVLAEAPFDRYTCVRDCGMTSGGFGASNGSYGIYSNCMAKCETKFWEEFDKTVNSLSKPSQERLK